MPRKPDRRTVGNTAKTELNSIQFVNSELVQIQVESISWIPLEEVGYFHLAFD